MCLLIAKPKNTLIPIDHLENGFTANPDGAGFAYLHKGKVRIEKGFRTHAAFLRAWNQIDPLETPAIVHFRWATHGSISTENCHPFPLPGGVAFAHNGIIPDYGSPTQSDTRAFADAVLDPWLAQDARLIHAPAWKAQILAQIGGSKLAFLAPSGGLEIVGENRGIWQAGVWYSNDSFRPWTPRGFQWAPMEDEAAGWEPEEDADDWIKEDLTCEDCREAILDGVGWYNLRDGGLFCSACRSARRAG